MAIMIHPVHRRMAELVTNSKAFASMNHSQLLELIQCLQVNADLVREIDGYKEAAYAAQCNDQMDLVQHFTEKHDEMEAKCT